MLDVNDTGPSNIYLLFYETKDGPQISILPRQLLVLGMPIFFVETTGRNSVTDGPTFLNYMLWSLSIQ